ncbi:MAG: AraC family transcriptional regulator [Faecalimonas sp.]|nr:AraC family transcriptional regulator [Faecalimonas sp.]
MMVLREIGIIFCELSHNTTKEKLAIMHGKSEIKIWNKSFDEAYGDVKIYGYGGFGFSSYGTTAHTHPDFYEITYIISGICTHIYGGNSKVITPGTLLLMTPHSTHRIYAEPLQTTFFAICIRKDYFHQFLEQHFPDFADNALPKCTQLHLDNADLTYLEHLGHQLSVPHPSSHVADTILYLVLRNLFYRRVQSKTSKTNHVQYLLSILNEPINLNLSAKNLYEAVPDISIPALIKNFKEQTGYTIVEYKTKKKMEFAADMLQNTDKKVIDIAYELHYESLSYFLRCFKKEFGMTPTEYRNQYR